MERHSQDPIREKKAACKKLLEEIAKRRKQQSLRWYKKIQMQAK
jgi:hypothetical protein